MEWSVAERGPRVVVEAWCENKDDGLYKACAVGKNGTCVLGTMIPENGKLCLRRTLTVDSLKRQGAWPIERVEGRMSHSFRGTSPTIPWSDEMLRCCARRMPCHTVRRVEDGFVLTVPFDPCAPFPLPPLFCLGRVENGRLIFCFREDGTPCLFRPDGKNTTEAEP